MPPAAYPVFLPIVADGGLADVGAGGWAGVITAFGVVLAGIGAGFWKLIDRFLGELAKRDVLIESVAQTIKEVGKEAKEEGTANRLAVESLKNTFAGKLDEVIRQAREENQRLTDRQFGLATDSLGSLSAIKQEVGEVKADVEEVKADVAEVKGGVGVIAAALKIEVPPRQPPGPPKRRGPQP